MYVTKALLNSIILQNLRYKYTPRQSMWIFYRRHFRSAFSCSTLISFPTSLLISCKIGRIGLSIDTVTCTYGFSGVSRDYRTIECLYNSLFLRSNFSGIHMKILWFSFKNMLLKCWIQIITCVTDQLWGRNTYHTHAGGTFISMHNDNRRVLLLWTHYW